MLWHINNWMSKWVFMKVAWHYYEGIYTCMRSLISLSEENGNVLSDITICFMNIRQNHCEGHTESSWVSQSHYEGRQIIARIYKVIVNTIPSLIAHKESLWWYKIIVKATKIIVMDTQSLWGQHSYCEIYNVMWGSYRGGVKVPQNHYKGHIELLGAS